MYLTGIINVEILTVSSKNVFKTVVGESTSKTCLRSKSASSTRPMETSATACNNN